MEKMERVAHSIASSFEWSDGRRLPARQVAKLRKQYGGMRALRMTSVDRQRYTVVVYTIALWEKDRRYRAMILRKGRKQLADILAEGRPS